MSQSIAYLGFLFQNSQVFQSKWVIIENTFESVSAKVFWWITRDYTEN